MQERRDGNDITDLLFSIAGMLLEFYDPDNPYWIADCGCQFEPGAWIAATCEHGKWLQGRTRLLLMDDNETDEGGAQL